jgi:transposase
VCQEYDLAESAVRRWVRQAEVDTGARPGTTTGDAEGASRLRKQLREVIEELDILARAVGVSASVSRWGCPSHDQGSANRGFQSARLLDRPGRAIEKLTPMAERRLAWHQAMESAVTALPG